jgi:dTDP-4-dehydrorhamnose reductase
MLKYIYYYNNLFFNHLYGYGWEFKNQIFNFINKYVSNRNQKVFGIYNLSSRKISKYSLLKKIAKTYKKKILIKKDFKIRLNRTLDSTQIKKKILYSPPNWKQMLNDMYKKNKFLTN